MSRAKPSRAGLELLLRSLKLPGFFDHYEEVAKAAEKEGWGFETYLRQLAELEVSERRERRVARLLRQSGLPPEKTLETFDTTKVPVKVRRQLPKLCEGGFLAEATNVLAFGLPGRGKTHLLSAIGHQLIERGHKVLFRPTALMVQQLLIAKRELRLEEELKRLDRFEAVILDDIGYVQQDREEMEVLFTFFAARYERRSVLITSNLLFSEWERIFKDPMTTAAAIDRLVHHSVILELTGKSVRAEAAKKRANDNYTQTPLPQPKAGKTKPRKKTKALKS
ncbi:MAG: ATP-binding protein [Gemmatimonadales bacterium]|jgi:DNA replication protein DnaC|nr:ATP-binding protein [Gemmatimonadales bacterium]